MDENGKLPLALCKQAILKMESAAADIHEIIEDEAIDDDDRFTFRQLASTLTTMVACVTNIVSKEMGEEEFLSEEIDMDAIEHFQYEDFEEPDILDTVAD